MRGRIYLVAGVLAVFFGSQASAQIDGSPHDLAGEAPAGADNGEICVYCHTPHGARPQGEIEAPLWNKPGGTGTYTTYDSTTLDGTVLAVGSVSVACLTCHDGTQAVDAIINAPGSGLGTLTSGTAGNTVTGTPVPNLGTDLSNDHPIGIQYGGFGGGPGGVKIDADFKGTGEGLQTAQINGLDRWWVDTEATANGTREKSDMILYTRDNGGTDQPFVECATCHDPHQGNGTATEVNFMRISNNNSDLCLACHVK